MTDKDAVTLADELERLIEAARGCEFDLVPADGPIARIALFMHENGDRIATALKPATERADAGGLGNIVDHIPDDDIRRIADSKDVATCRARIRAALKPAEPAPEGEDASTDDAPDLITRLQAENARLEALLGEAREVLKPFATAADAVSKNDPKFPDDGAALRASFDWYVRVPDSDGVPDFLRKSVQLRDLRRARTFLATLGGSDA